MNTIELKLPGSWMEIPIPRVIRLAGMLQVPQTRSGFLLKAFLLITGIRPVKKTPVIIDHTLHHWFRHGKRDILLSNRQLVDASQKLTFLLEDTKIPVPLWKGSRFWFTPPVFGLYNLNVEQYLNCENNFMAFTANGDTAHLKKLAINLWAPARINRQPAKRIARLPEDVKNAIILFYTGSRDFLAGEFPTLFSRSGGSGPSDVTALIRTLNGGDVTRNEGILKVQLWDALKQLEDMALAAERLKNSLHK
jgi:hypothetical protein